MILSESFLQPSREYIKNNPRWRQMPVHSWRQRTGLEIIYDEVSSAKLDELWKNWNKMPHHMKELSDKKCIELYGMPNEKHYHTLKSTSIYDGFKFILHRHNPRSGTYHFDLRFMDLKNKKLLHSFAAPDDFLNRLDKCTLFKTRDHDPRWLTLKSYRLETMDEGTVNYKLYKPYNYFLLDFNGSVMKGTYQLFKLRNKQRNDVWLLVKKK